MSFPRELPAVNVSAQELLEIPSYYDFLAETLEISDYPHAGGLKVRNVFAFLIFEPS